MNKTELIEVVAKRVNLKKMQAAEVVDAIQETVQSALNKGDSVSLIGFGTFLVAERAARTGRNPRTGGEITIPAARVPRFRPGKAFRDAVAVVVEKPQPVAAVAAKASPPAVPALPAKKDAAPAKQGSKKK